MNLNEDRSLDSLLSQWRDAVDLTAPEVAQMRAAVVTAPRFDAVLSVGWWHRVLSVPVLTPKRV